MTLFVLICTHNPRMDYLVRALQPLKEQDLPDSGGQCQSIALARALYQRLSLLILDEATSALGMVVKQSCSTRSAALPVSSPHWWPLTG